MITKSNLYCSSGLYDERSFYPAFLSDLAECRDEVIIESPYITSKRMTTFYQIFDELLARKVKIYVLTRDPREHYEGMEMQSEEEIERFESIGVQTLLCTGNHHRKLAILDRKILWEGSLNILSQTRSREIMRRMDGGGVAMEMFRFLKLRQFVE
jgi:phosphatidylserine/phosphatidylglycerophosphate/cardiolipin synthase-like enzyme